LAGFVGGHQTKVAGESNGDRIVDPGFHQVDLLREKERPGKGRQENEKFHGNKISLLYNNLSMMRLHHAIICSSMV
jgi:hypothetical protein